MALGGGIFVAKNKKLPGSYINFVSLAMATSNVSDRGVAAFGLALDWGVDGEVFTVTKADFEKNSLKLFGYEYGHNKLKGLRDLFRNIHTLYAYKLNSGTGKAANTYATAKYAGVRGNALTTIITTNADDTNKFDVSTVFDGAVVDRQTVGAAAELVDNDYCIFKKDAELALTAGVPMTGGESDTVTAAHHQAFIDLIEAYSFNAIGVVSDERETGATKVNDLYANFAKRMRDEMGVKFQAVVFRNAADHEGVVNVENLVTDEGENAASLVYWVTGIVAGTAINASALNTVYDGEFTIDVKYTQAQLEGCIDAGKFTLHRVGADIRVLCDVNSLVNTNANKNDLFKENQTIRVIDCIANDIAELFNTKYLGRIPNNAAGRVSLWTDIVKHHQELARIGAIENFDENAVVVEQGDTKRSVVVQDAITVVNAMAQLYMTCVVG